MTQLGAGANGEQSLSPVPSSIALGDDRHDVSTDKLYSVFTHREKWFIVGLASCAAIFRRVGYTVYAYVLLR
jgi:hypothetical protein